MKLMKKTVSVILVGVMALAMAACGENSAYKAQVDKASKALKAAGFAAKNEDYLLKNGDDPKEAYYAETTNREMLDSIISDVSGYSSKDANKLFYSAVKEEKGESASEINAYIIDFIEAEKASKYYDAIVKDFDSMLEDSEDFKDLIEEANGTFVAESEDKDGHYRFCYVMVCEDYDLDNKLYVDMILEDTAITTVYADCDGVTGKKIEDTLNTFFKEYGIKGATDLA